MWAFASIVAVEFGIEANNIGCNDTHDPRIDEETCMNKDENDCKKNKKTMGFEWTIADNFTILVKKIDDPQLFTEFAQAPTPSHKVVNVGIKLIMHTGLFEQEYEEWHGKEAN